jgi:hypothetical protein
MQLIFILFHVKHMGVLPYYTPPLSAPIGVGGFLVLYMREQFFKKFQKKILHFLNKDFFFFISLKKKNSRKNFQFFNYDPFFNTDSN